MNEFEKWVEANYLGKIMEDFPEDFDPDKEMYYKIDSLQYGPILEKDIPSKFKK